MCDVCDKYEKVINEVLDVLNENECQYNDSVKALIAAIMHLHGVMSPNEEVLEHNIEMTIESIKTFPLELLFMNRRRQNG